jgi:hypothetical protein
MLTLALAGVLAASAPPPGVPLRATLGDWAQLGFRSRMVVRVQSWPARPPVVRTLKEKKGPRCIRMNAIVGAAILDQGGVDFVLRGGERIRARLPASCPALNYYSGFYVLPPADGQICGGRDAVRDRAGGVCEIDRFRRLVPAK